MACLFTIQHLLWSFLQQVVQSAAELAHSGLTAEHHRIGAVQHGIGYIAGLCASDCASVPPCLRASVPQVSLAMCDTLWSLVCRTQLTLPTNENSVPTHTHTRKTETTCTTHIFFCVVSSIGFPESRPQPSPARVGNGLSSIEANISVAQTAYLPASCGLSDWAVWYKTCQVPDLPNTKWKDWLQIGSVDSGVDVGSVATFCQGPCRKKHHLSQTMTLQVCLLKRNPAIVWTIITLANGNLEYENPKGRVVVGLCLGCS